MKKFLMLAISVLILASSVSAQEVWSGRTYLFEKANWADWLLPENQDRITENVWLTRQDTQGLYNIAIEDMPDNWGAGSPLDTEWAHGDAVDWPNLTFMTWLEVCDTYPCYYLVGYDLCVHLISDDIYIDIRFESWTCGGQGGGFSYLRAEGTTPVEPATISTIKALY